MFHFIKKKTGLMGLLALIVILFTACSSPANPTETLPTLQPVISVTGEYTTEATTEAPTLDTIAVSSRNPDLTTTTPPRQTTSVKKTTGGSVTTRYVANHTTYTRYSGIDVAYTRLPGTIRLTGADFGIEQYRSPYDRDNDGIDDQTDMVEAAKKYLAEAPQYNASSWFKTGYNFRRENGVLEGVCTDVIANALRDAGYDLQALIEEDIKNHPNWYVDAAESQINFRRVRNQWSFLEHHAQSLTLDLSKIDEWQPGDIVVFFGTSGYWNGHIVMLSDRRAEDGVPYVLHHATPGQTNYEEDYLVSSTKTLVGHYRWIGYTGE